MDSSIPQKLFGNYFDNGFIERIASLASEMRRFIAFSASFVIINEEFL